MVERTQTNSTLVPNFKKSELKKQQSQPATPDEQDPLGGLSKWEIDMRRKMA